MRAADTAAAARAAAIRASTGRFDGRDAAPDRRSAGLPARPTR